MNDISMQQVEAFVRVAWLQSFSKAAVEMGLAQSTVSARINGLEERLQRRLFQRARGRIQLSDDGRALLPRAEQLLNAGAELLREAVAGEGGVLKIGANNTIAGSFLPLILGAYVEREERARRPPPSIEIQVERTPYLMLALMEREVDLAFVSPELAHPQCQQLWERESRAVLVAIADHHLAGASVPVTELAGERFIAYSVGPAERIVKSIQARLKEPLRLTTSTNSTHLVRSLVYAGAGLAYMPFDVVDSDIRRGTLAEITVEDLAPAPWRSVLVKWKGVQLDTAAQAFVEFAQSMFGTIESN